MKKLLLHILVFLGCIGLPVWLIFNWDPLLSMVILVFGIGLFEHYIVRSLPELTTPRASWTLFVASFLAVFILAVIPCLFFYMDLFYIVAILLFGPNIVAVLLDKSVYKKRRILLNTGSFFGFVLATVLAYFLYENGWLRISFN